MPVPVRFCEEQRYGIRERGCVRGIEPGIGPVETLGYEIRFS